LVTVAAGKNEAVLWLEPTTYLCGQEVLSTFSFSVGDEEYAVKPLGLTGKLG